MAGNENHVVKYLFDNLGKISLNHIGLVEQIGNPDKSGNIIRIDNYEQLKLVKTQAASKKADIYINEKGISVKQKGGCFLFNRLQRAGIVPVLEKLNIKEFEKILYRFDEEVIKYHNQERESRNIFYKDIFKEKEEDFKSILKYLMMDGSPKKESQHKAELILDASKRIKSEKDIDVFTFDEYFNEFKEKIVFSIRRQWIGQNSDSEHRRALSIAKKAKNKKWVFDDIIAEPPKWRTDYSIDERKTVYFLMIERLR